MRLRCQVLRCFCSQPTNGTPKPKPTKPTKKASKQAKQGRQARTHLASIPPSVKGTQVGELVRFSPELVSPREVAPKPTGAAQVARPKKVVPGRSAPWESPNSWQAISTQCERWRHDLLWRLQVQTLLAILQTSNLPTSNK